MKPPLRFLLHGSAAVTLGIAAMHFLIAGRSVGPGPAGLPDSMPDRTAATPGETAESELWRHLRLDPYMQLSDEEVARLAATLDITRESTWRQLNGIASQQIYDALWFACIARQIGKMDLQDLMEIASHAIGHNDGWYPYEPIMSEIYRSGTANRELTTPRGRDLLGIYIRQMGGEPRTLDEARRLVPADAGPQWQAAAIDLWARAQEPSLELARQLMALPPDTVDYFPKLSAADRRALIEDVAVLPEAQRNDDLKRIGLSMYHEPLDEEMEVLKQITSSSTQQRVVANWLSGSDDSRRSLLGAIASAAETSPNLRQILPWVEDLGKQLDAANMHE